MTSLAYATSLDVKNAAVWVRQRRAGIAGPVTNTTQPTNAPPGQRRKAKERKVTTTVKIEAHCDANTEVFVTVDDGVSGETFVLHDGESAVRYVYDNRKITVMEQPAS